MNDPWDVKSVRQSGQYISCMKLNGVPLLPPVLSKECRKEMQYYKLLAKEVEKRIDLLKPYVTDSDSGSTEDKTDVPDLPPDYDHLYQCNKQDVQDVYDVDIPISNDKLCRPEPYHTVASNLSKNLDGSPDLCHPQNFVIDLSVNIKDCGNGLLEKVRNPQLSDLPERDYNNTPKKKNLCKTKKELLTDIENSFHHKKSKEITEDLLSFKFDIDNVVLNQSDPLPDMSMEDGPASISAKSFTGSLNNIHRESQKETCPLLRQSSYTVLNPSPQLIAHLKVQSLSTGVDVTSISMSESLSNISGNKKRRSWDLESAKVKWSSMALELKQKKVAGIKINGNKNNSNKTPPARKPRNVSPIRARSVAPDKNRRGSLPSKTQPKSEPIQRVNRSPVQNIPSNRTIVKEPINKPNQKTQSQKQSPKQSPNQSPNQSPTKQSPTQSPTTQSPTKQYAPINKSPNLPPNIQPVNKQQLNQIISNSEDPAERVRELYEKIQNQQLQQMNNLIEKQRREQMLLQQVFEEQNSILYKQLKTICPKSPIEAKEAWVDKLQHTPDRGPVSLSQLINHKPETRAESPISSTLTDTHNNLNKCDTVLRRSRELTASMKRQPRRSPPAKPRNDKSPTDGSRTRTHSPNFRQSSASRRLNYETSASPVSDFGATSVSREFEPILTDRTNDTMAGLNVSFPTDSDDCPATYNSGYSQCGGKEITMIHCPQPSGVAPRSSTDSAIRVMEQTIHDSMNTMPYRVQNQSALYNCPTPQQVSAASRIVAHAKGYLVRRLMRTERVQATVQTIKDALLCALQLHQDRAGIRGADVDLHRRLIQQITAACYTLHDTFITSSPAERCAQIAADRERRRQKPVVRHYRHKSDLMSQSHSGVFPPRAHRASSSLMTQSNYETFSGDKVPARRYMPSPRRRPWR
ncbi:hypothetical protein MSG28_010516 [Choristoneura fumiferana]|uniref:Uncharacterized protein n=1 Tax=Choristoneura fumiferana TaxID=7141 RepID=A0ACC0KL30_CHOFU|nr:hypothetical protein MSG28_010516 [Choristoneura fumiferana]